MFNIMQFSILELIIVSKTFIYLVQASSMLLLMILLIYHQMTCGQYGDKLQGDYDDLPDESLENTQAVNDDDDWLFGFIYNKASDPSLWIPKRIGYGWTVNYGHPLGKMIYALLLLLVLGSAAFSIWTSLQ